MPTSVSPARFFPALREFSGMQRTGLILLVAGLVAVAIAYALVLARIGAAEAPFLIALGASAVLAGIACLGAARRGRATPRLAAAIVVAFCAVAGGLIVGLSLPAPTPDGALLLGLPRATAWMLLFTGGIPLLLLPVAFAIAFEDEVIDAADLERLRAESAQHASSGRDA